MFFFLTLFTIVLWNRRVIDRLLLIFPNWPKSPLVVEFHQGEEDGDRQVNLLGLY